MTGPSKNAAIADRDLSVVWHPCTQMQDHERLPLIPIARGEGVWLQGFEGRRYLDGISSWWVNLFGHANPRINAAIEFVKDRKSGERYDWRERHGLRAYEHALAQGALLRPIGNVIYLMPPYVITPEQIDWLATVARGAVDAACA